MRSRSRGFTLAELLVVLAVIGVVIAVLVVGGSYVYTGCTNEIQEEHAREGATLWAAELGIKDPKISCASQDSDGDGYVSCTIGQKVKDGEVKATAVECAGAITFSKGCRLPKAVLAQ